MAARKRREEPTDDERKVAEAKRLEYYNEEICRPLKYVKHDTNAHDDPKLQDLRDDHGFDALGRWWLLVELLAGRVNHCYDIRRPNGWRRLAHDLEFGRTEEGVRQCKEFIATLLDLHLLDQASYADFHHVRSARIDRNADEYARDVAQRRYAIWCRWGDEKPQAKA
jgi:hypothetical protein